MYSMRRTVAEPLLLILSMLAVIGSADIRISGPIAVSNSEIIATGVTYTF